MAGFLKNHGKFTPIKTNTEENADTNDTAMPTVKIPSFTKKKLGGLNKKAIKEEDTVSDIKEENTEETISKTEDTTITIKPSLGGKKKLGIKKKTEENKEQPVNETEKNIEEVSVEKESIKEEVEAASKDKTEEQLIEDAKDEPTPVTTKKQTKKRSTSKKTINNTITVSDVDESKRVTLAEAEAIMKPIVAPTTEIWEQEKKDVYDALGNIKVKQDMTIEEIKHALAELDDFNFEVLMKQQDAETMYTGTKQNYEAVKALAIANATSTNAEGRKAEAILACQNYVTPTGEVINLNEYMLLIEERYKFYQKIREGIDFKKYSLVNYNTVLKIANN